jgi:glucose-1-phosphate adenylyltransferase
LTSVNSLSRIGRNVGRGAREKFVPRVPRGGDVNDRAPGDAVDVVARRGAARAASPAVLARNALAIVLAGGRGSRLQELTAWRAKPAVPFGGKFRIVDFALSNCVNSGIRRIGICTQYKAQSLIRHVQRGWSFLDGRFDEFVELLPAQQRVEPSWYRGTADAVYQNLDIVNRHEPDHVLILSGDQVYKMDYLCVLAEHVARGAELTIACIDVPIEDATAFGVVEVAADGRIGAFEEKPERPAPMPGRPGRALASMGIYAVDAPLLDECLRRDARDRRSSHDFGADVIPRLLADGTRVFAHDFTASCVHGRDEAPYWRDVGTVDSYWKANIELTDVVPHLDLYDAHWPIWTYQEQVPPAKFVFDDEGRRGCAVDSLVAGGCIISGSTVRRSLLFSSVRVHSYATIEDSVLLPHVDVGRRVVVKRAVVDKHCRLPAGLEVGVDAARDRERFHVTEGGITLITPDMLGQRVHHLP